MENKVPEEYLNSIFCKSSETMVELPDNSIHLMITSTPYNGTKGSDGDFDLLTCLKSLKSVWAEVYRVLVPGGRACINVANRRKTPYIPLHNHICRDMTDIGFLMRGEIIWNKTSIGSQTGDSRMHLSVANPVLRNIHEYILVFSKDSFTRLRKNKENTIRKDQFLRWSKSVWTIPSVAKSGIGRSGSFPEHLAYRLIQLYSFKGDVVLDPFAGIGGTWVAAIKSDRYYVGYDKDQENVQLAKRLIANLHVQLELFEDEDLVSTKKDKKIEKASQETKQVRGRKSKLLPHDPFADLKYNPIS